MAKAPVAGRVKTRLAAEAGVALATRFARQSLVSVLSRVASPLWSTVLAVTPESARCSRIWPRGVELIPQGEGDLGRRMQRQFERAPPGPVMIVGTDVPLASRRQIAAAFAMLRRHDAVLGPAEDGGYWLVGLRRCPRILRPFAGVRWSTEHALSDTAANLRACSVAQAATLYDVDTAADLARCAWIWSRRIHPVI